MAVSLHDVPAADHDALRRLYAESLTRNRPGFIQSTAEQPLPDIADICCAFQNNNGAMLGLYIDGELVGFGGLCRHETSSERAEICKLHLHQAYQGRGLGRQLLQSLIDRAAQKGCKTVELHVTATQVQALGLYVRMGFKQTARQLYQSPDGLTYDTIYMEREVDLRID